MSDRIASLNNLLNLTVPISVAANELASVPWDSAMPLVPLLPAHILGVLTKFISGATSAAEVEAWANVIECREDVDYSSKSPVGVALHELANPALTQPLTPQSARTLIKALSGNAT